MSQSGTAFDGDADGGDIRSVFLFSDPYGFRSAYRTGHRHRSQGDAAAPWKAAVLK